MDESSEVMKLSIGLADFTCCQRNHYHDRDTEGDERW